MKRLSIAASALMLGAMVATAQVTLEEVTRSIPTYPIGAPEVDPFFFTGRVYQGAEGYIYPYPLYDQLTDTPQPKDYKELKLGNEYVDISVLPEIGGRIFSATDKTDDYHFFYTQTGIKPALIGMLGAWLSGGVEWNIPDHHRATTYLPTNWKLEENPDGSKTIWVGETDLRHRLKWTVGLTVFPGRSWVEARVKVTNPTEMIQSMLYWANVSVHCGEDYRVIFPPDVEIGADHHKVYFTPWPEGPIADGQSGDLSLWKNFTANSRSIFAWGSDMEFLAGYDYGKDAGTVHVANRHVVPGKKFFLWGNNPNGQMWNKILSDNDGHYLELMVGAYSDNQPDYSWLAPGETREFSQIWFPIKGIGGVKNATVEGAMNFEPDVEKPGNYKLGYIATKDHKRARAIVKAAGLTIFEKEIAVSPEEFFVESVAIPAEYAATPDSLYTALLDEAGNVLVDFTPIVPKGKELPKVIDGTKNPKDYDTVEELYLAGLRVDQFNNARLSYMDFYEEALQRDSMDARVNVEVGKHYARQARWDQALKHLNRAQARLSHDYTRVKDAEALYYIGVVNDMIGNDKEAEDALWAATWTPDFKHPAFVALAKRAARQGDYAKALDMIEEALNVGARDADALTVKAYTLRKLGRNAEAREVLKKVGEVAPLDYFTDIENSLLENGNLRVVGATMPRRSEGFMAVQELLEVVNQYLALGDTEAAMNLLNEAEAVGEPFSSSPMTAYYRAYLSLKNGDRKGAETAMQAANSRSHINSYPLRVEEIGMFENLAEAFPQDSKLPYHLGNLLYYLGQKERGLGQWKHSAELDPSFSVALRNAGFGEGRNGNLTEAIDYYRRAVVANPNDPVLLTELDKLSEQANLPGAERQKYLEAHRATVVKHDDAVMRLLELYNLNGDYEKGIKLMDGRHFHLWEGGGHIHDIFVDAHLLNGLRYLNKQWRKAEQQFELASTFPANLEVAPNNNGNYDAQTYYLRAQAFKGEGNAEKCHEMLVKASESKVPGGLSPLAYYKTKALQELGETAKASELLATMEQTLAKSRENLVDNYAKFGDDDANRQKSRQDYYAGLVALLQGNPSEAKTQFQSALELYPGNIWAKQMMR